MNNMTDKEFNDKYVYLISKGYSISSKAVQDLFKQRALEQSNALRANNTQKDLNGIKNNLRGKSIDDNTQFGSFKKYRTRTSYPYEQTSQSSERKNNQRNFNTRSTKSNTYTDINNSGSTSYKPHIIVYPNGNHKLLDYNFNEIDSEYVPTINRILFNKLYLWKFKKQLKKDKKLYIEKCKEQNLKPNKDFLNMYKKLFNYYFFGSQLFAAKADYAILELLRRNITKLSSNYSNYQTACTEYLKELHDGCFGNPASLPFNLVYIESEIPQRKSSHDEISTTLKCDSEDAITYYKQSLPQNASKREQFLKAYYVRNHGEPSEPKFEYAKKIHAPTISIDR